MCGRFTRNYVVFDHKLVSMRWGLITGLPDSLIPPLRCVSTWERTGPTMRYKLEWRADGTGPLTPETFDTEDQAKSRARELLAAQGTAVVIDVWNEDETWQIVTPAGVARWCGRKMP